MNIEAKKLYEEGLIQFRKEHWKMAEERFSRALHFTPREINVLEALASTVALLGDNVRAKKYFFQAIKLSKSSPSISLLNNFAHLLQRMEDFDQAIVQFRRLLKQAPKFAKGWSNLGECYLNQKKIGMAVKCYERCQTLEPDKNEILNSLSYCYHTLCQWDKAHIVDEILLKISTEKIKSGGPALLGSFPALFVKTNAETLKLIAQSHSRDLVRKQKVQGIALPKVTRKPYDGERIKLGYFSVALSNHPTTQLIHDMFQHHDHSKFEIFIFAITNQKKCSKYYHIKESVENFYELNSLNHFECAEFIQSKALDILVDLDGVIKNNRKSALSLKPAPIQIAWLGYPGTSGAPWIDYILADKIVLPAKYEPFYTEKVLRMPDCYQFNSYLSCKIKPSSRKEWGLPQEKFIFASFNVSRKFDHESFDAWCEILRQVDNSILWLLISDDVCYQNLIKAMNEKGIGSDRLIRANRVDNQKHLSRFQCADLFLDSFICNAHTTCTEALAAGLVVVTCKGETFQSRVAASILTAAGLQSCITANTQEYIMRVVELATSTDELQKIKNYLLKDKNKNILFDQKKWVKNWEEILKSA